MITYKIYSKVIGLAVAALTLAACSDTWDDHYDKKGEGTNDATLWQAITQNSNLSNFAKVVQGCGFDKSLRDLPDSHPPTNNSLPKRLMSSSLVTMQRKVR